MGAPRTMNTHALSGVQICDLSMENVIALPKLYTVEKLPVLKNHIPTTDDLSQWSHLRDIQLPQIDAEIGLLIGNNVPDAYTPIEVRTGLEHSPHATRTRLGWVLWNVTRTGSSGSASVQDRRCTVNRVEIVAVEESEQLKQMDRMVRQNYNLDFPERIIEDQKQHSQQDKLFLEKVADSLTLKDGHSHYEIALPFAKTEVKFPNNYSQAENRLMTLKKKMERDNKFRDEYVSFMDKMIQKEHAKPVPEDETDPSDGHIWYIPHHGVYHPKKEKLRVVFNCAAIYEGISLNSKFLSGPDLTNNLLGVLMRFRQEKYAAMGDIQAMFYQVRVPQEHWNYQRFLWWPEGDYSQPQVKYMMCVHMFGTTSSPSCANAALMKTAMDNEKNFDPETADIIRNNFYVDDCLLSAPSIEETVRHVSQVSEMCKKGGFLLTKWVSNSCEVLDRIPEDKRAEEVKDMNFELEDMPNERALGVCWTVNSDTLGFKITENTGEATRRQILSVVSSVYDPLGLVLPFVLKAKILLQELCRQGLGWDDVVNDQCLKVWKQWCNDLPHLEHVSVPRCYKHPDFGPVKTCQLHMFSDASCDGYGVAAYVRFTNDKDEVHCSLIMAKARVTPLKKVTIPRLELTAACIAVRLSYIVQRELQYHFNDTFYWTDSMSVIKYINNETSRFQTFVANRIAVIRDGSDPEQWRHTPTQCNPADAASRGLTIDNLLVCDQWFQGPRFLWEAEREWPPKDHSLDVDEKDPEITKSVNMTMVDDSVEPMTRLFNASSSWWKLKKIVGWIIVYMEKLQHLVKQRKTKVLNNSEQNADRQRVHEAAQSVKIKSKTKKSETKTRLSPVILQKAEMAIIRCIQMQQFPSVFKVLRSTRQDSKNSAQIGKPIRKLDPILVDGVIRVGGRLDRACIPYEAKHPVLLPKLSPVSKLIVQESHEYVGHMGKGAMLTHLRQQYWIVGVGSLIKKITSKCVVCRKYRASNQEQKMADLPEDRLTPEEPPFSRVGMDFFGPFLIKRGRSSVKRYGVVFTCMAIRAVHLEIAASLDTASCINAIRRFIARRGRPKKIRSDNGTNLVGCNKELREEIEKWNLEQIHQTLLQKNIVWDFNPPSGSHHGGI